MGNGRLMEADFPFGEMRMFGHQTEVEVAKCGEYTKCYCPVHF